jgi:hypothetical protein
MSRLAYRPETHERWCEDGCEGCACDLDARQAQYDQAHRLDDAKDLPVARVIKFPGGLLIPRRGMRNTRRNRRWFAIMCMLGDLVADPEQVEQIAWATLKLYEDTK